MSPDGDFFITSAGTVNNTIWVGSGGQERQVTFQGESGRPIITADGSTLFYVEQKSGTGGQIMRMDLANQTTEPVLPGFRIALEEISWDTTFDVSPDGQRIAWVALDEDDNRQLWFATLGKGESPVQLPAEFPANILFGPDGSIFYSDGTEVDRFVYRIGEDGSDRQQVLDVPIIWLEDVSADGQWLTARISHGKYRVPGVPDHEPEGFVAIGTSVWAYRVDGTQEPQLLSNDCFWAMWGPNERYMYFEIGAEGTWLAVPIPEGQILPDLPPEGLPPQSAATSLGQIVVEGEGGLFMSSFYPGADPSIYAISRPSAHRNLYRVPIQ